MDKNISKKKLKLSSSSTNKKITNFFKSVEQFESKSNSDNVHSSAENKLKSNVIPKENTVKDKKNLGSEKKCDKKDIIKQEKSVKKDTFKNEKYIKKRNNKETKHRISEEKKSKSATVGAVDNPDHFKANTSNDKSTFEEKCTPDKTIRNKGQYKKSELSKTSNQKLQNTSLLKFLNKSPSILPQDKLDDEVHQKKKKVKAKCKSSKHKSSNDGELNLKTICKDTKCNNTLVLFNFLNIQQTPIKVNETRCAVKSDSNKISKTRDDSREVKDERQSDNNDVKNKISTSAKHSVNRSKSLEKTKLIHGGKHRKTNSANINIFKVFEKDAKPDKQDCEKSESKKQKNNSKKRKRSSSRADNSDEEVHKKRKSLNNSSILRYTSPSKAMYKTESDKRVVGSKKKKCSSDIEQVKTVTKKKTKFCNMNRSVNGLDGWLCSKPSKSKQFHNKYGIKVPSYTNIMKNVQRRKQYSEQLKEACRIIDSQRFEVTCVKQIEDVDDHCEVLTCTDLSLEKIEEYFERFSEDCLDIINGRVSHDRHDKYMFRASKDMITMNFLVYNISTMVFSVEQKKTLAGLCERHFDDCDIYKPMQYYFKVLIPELCLRIFMDVHDMDKDSAIKYLENMPVPEV